MSSFNVGNWLVVIALACLAGLPLAEAVYKRLRKRRETDREVLDRLAPRPPAPYTSGPATPPSPVPAAKRAPANGSSLSTKSRVVLTLLYVPGSLALYMFWSLIGPGLRREVAGIDIGSPELAAILWTGFAVLVHVGIALPYLLIWRRGSRGSVADVE